jgi:hypothetical protein
MLLFLDNIYKEDGQLDFRITHPLFYCKLANLNHFFLLFHF